nr:MAG TPA_asm: hypothetical protein [Microviridae sp.]
MLLVILLGDVWNPYIFVRKQSVVTDASLLSCPTIGKVTHFSMHL